MLVTNFNGSGGAILDRLIQAYGFKQKSQYAEHVGLSSSNLAMRYKRDAFPADLVVQCLIDTDVELNWILYGQGNPPSAVQAQTAEKGSESHPMKSLTDIERVKLTNGELTPVDFVTLESKLFLDKVAPHSNLLAVIEGEQQYIVNRSFKAVVDGKWLLDIEGMASLRHLSRLPGGRVRISGGDAEFECALNEISATGIVVMTLI
ncbi:MAG: phage repressor protein CI [Pantoea sp.]|uniref:phage repressor protein CI n=1 Tax=Pantoea septica TaxID=472695 RepID=UPI001C11D61A|nr:phage repressor protein CI [Pantoea septica]MBU5376609.1 helix-turn-helix domain-containing protein [Pantoea septica]MDU6439832.1 phage repressor protein CI [Pantoea sp.]